MISPLAHVDPSAKLGENVTIHPFAYIDKNVEIGDGCEIMPYTSIIRGTRMGKNNKVYQLENACFTYVSIPSSAFPIGITFLENDNGI